VPGDDYPIFAEVPETSFLCDGQADGGYYADPEAQCQVFHICANDGQGGRTKFSFLCPNGTLFQQQYFVCDWWFNVDCSLAESFYGLNDQIAAEREAISAGGSQGAGGRGAAAAGGQRSSAQGGGAGDVDGGSFFAGGSAGRSGSNNAAASKSGSKAAGKGGASKGSSGGGSKRGSSVTAAASANQNIYAAPSSFGGGQSSANYGAPAGSFGGDFGFGSEAGGPLGGYARNARDLEQEGLQQEHEKEEETHNHHMEEEEQDLD
jgi:hypothetical protein